MRVTAEHETSVFLPLVHCLLFGVTILDVLHHAVLDTDLGVLSDVRFLWHANGAIARRLVASHVAQGFHLLLRRKLFAHAFQQVGAGFIAAWVGSSTRWLRHELNVVILDAELAIVIVSVLDLVGIECNNDITRLIG